MNSIDNIAKNIEELAVGNTSAVVAVGVLADTAITQAKSLEKIQLAAKDEVLARLAQPAELVKDSVTRYARFHKRWIDELATAVATMFECRVDHGTYYMEKGTNRHLIDVTFYGLREDAAFASSTFRALRDRINLEAHKMRMAGTIQGVAGSEIFKRAAVTELLKKADKLQASRNTARATGHDMLAAKHAAIDAKYGKEFDANLRRADAQKVEDQAKPKAARAAGAKMIVVNGQRRKDRRAVNDMNSLLSQIFMIGDQKFKLVHV